MAPKWPDSSGNSDEFSNIVKSHQDVESPPRRSMTSAKGIRGNTSLDLLNESSPLLSPQPAEFQEGNIQPLPGTPSGMLDWSEDDEEESKSVWYLFLLTLSMAG